MSTDSTLHEKLATAEGERDALKASISGLTAPEIDAELGRWQESIYGVICASLPEEIIDGRGCDSGDPLDLTLTEVSKALDIWSERHSALRQERDEWRRKLAESEAGNAKLREDIEYAIKVFANKGMGWKPISLQLTPHSAASEIADTRSATNKTWAATCIHHTDAQRKEAGCPVCSRVEIGRLKVDLLAAQSDSGKAYGQMVATQAKCDQLREALEPRATSTDSYGVPGSEWGVCDLCGAEDRPGIFSKGIPHEPTCPLCPAPSAALLEICEKAFREGAERKGDTHDQAWIKSATRRSLEGGE